MSPRSSPSVGVIGLGKIAQLKYLPRLSRGVGCELRALCDRTPGVLAGVADSLRFDEDRRFTDPDVVLRQPLDLIFVLTHDHLRVAREACRRGTSIFVEKPLCWSSAKACELRDAARESGARILTGYMRRHDPQVALFRSIVSERPTPLLVRAKNLAGGVKRWTDGLHPIVRPVGAEKETQAADLDAE